VVVLAAHVVRITGFKPKRDSKLLVDATLRYSSFRRTTGQIAFGIRRAALLSSRSKMSSVVASAND